MLSKGSELFMFEGQFYKIKARYIDRIMTEEDWTDLLNELTNLKQEYEANEPQNLYIKQSILGFIGFMRMKGD